MPAIRSIVILCTAFLGTLLMAAACETAPPVQEMSDARQAIAVAREAGAADLAAVELKAAEEYLQSAERKLNERNYPQARRDALHAKTKALNAIQLSESGKESGTD